MLKIGDMVKVIKPSDNNGEPKEYVKIGSICNVVSVDYEDDGTPYYGLSPIGVYDSLCWYYTENEVEKGKLVWEREV